MKLRGLVMALALLTSAALSGLAEEHPGKASIDCLVCHSTDYDFTKRVPFKDEQGRVVMGHDRSLKAAMSVGKPTAKNCMVCHERAGGGIYVNRGFEFTKESDAHAAKGRILSIGSHLEL